MQGDAMASTEPPRAAKPSSSRWRVAVALLACGAAVSCHRRPTGTMPTNSSSRPAHRSATAAHHAFRPFYFIHAADPHLGITKGNTRRFAELARQANALKPAFVFVAGDLVFRPKGKNFALLDEALEAFEVPVRMIPGNHDVDRHETLDLWRRRYGKDHYTFTHHNCEFICLNSQLLHRRTRHYKTHDARFEIEVAAQWAWLERAFARARSAKREHIIVCLHNPPFTKRPTERRKYTNMYPEPRRRLLALVRRYDVRVLLAGHIHRTREIRTHDFTIYTVGGTWSPTDLRGYGYRVFKVEKDRIRQTYVRLDRPLEALGF